MKTTLVVPIALMFLAITPFTLVFGKSTLIKETELVGEGENHAIEAITEDSMLNQKTLNKPVDFTNTQTEKTPAESQNPNNFPFDSFVKDDSTDKTDMWHNFAKVDEDSAEVVVGLNKAQPDSYMEVSDLIIENGGKLVNTVSTKGEVIAIVAKIPLGLVPSFAGAVQVSNLARYLEPNMKFKTQLVPNDPYWGMQWGPQKIEADYAWNTTIGDPSVLVAVIDTGIDWNHPDLAANYVAVGYDWVFNDTDPMDDHGHGTHVAGIIAAVLNNSEGIAGLAQVSIMAEKAINQYGIGYEDDLANAIIHAVDQGADILSNSWGGYEESALIYEAVKYAHNAGVLIVAAAGNEAWDVKLYPAAYDEVVAVTATDEFDNPASFTNFGDWVELAAPGANIFSTVWDNSYLSKSGTSMSTPHVSGVAALIWSQFPNKTRDWVRLWLRHTADDLGDTGFDIYYGYGMINARKAVEETPPDHDVMFLNWQTPPYIEPGGLATINSTVMNFGASDESNVTVQLLVNGSIVDFALVSFLANGSSTTVSFSWSPTVEGAHNVTSYIVPVPGEMVTENNVISTYIHVGFPVKAFVLDSAGTDLYTSSWEILNTNWYTYGNTLIHIDYTTLNIDDITYDDIAATSADVLIISCAYNWEFTDSEIDAITRYVYEGHGLIATAGTLYDLVPNNNKLATLFGLDETVTWGVTGTDLLHILNTTHPLFVGIPDPFVMIGIQTAVPSDSRWDSNELTGGTYLALGHYGESAIVAHRGLVYISPWLEVIPAYYHFNLQLLYNAFTWSRYQRPEHELIVSLDSPKLLEPGESTILNATVSNMGLNNETNVELLLLINGTVVDGATIPELPTGAFYTLSHSWTPSVEATYNVTSYAPSLTAEKYIKNNVKSASVEVLILPDILVVVDNDGANWIRGTSLPEFESALTAAGYDYFVLDESSKGRPSLGLLTKFKLVIWTAGDYWNKAVDATDAITLESYLALGGNILLEGEDIGYDHDADSFMVNVAHAILLVDWTGAPGLTVTDPDHPVTHGLPTTFTWLTHPPYDDGVAPTNGGFEVIRYTTTSWTAVTVFEGASNGSVLYYAFPLYSLEQPEGEMLVTNSVGWFLPQEHDLAATLGAPDSLEPGDSSLLNATVYNRGLSNETGVELFLLVNDTVVHNMTLPDLLTSSSHTLSYLWTPTVAGTYNLTAYAPPMPGENVTANNVVSVSVAVVRFTTISVQPPTSWASAGESFSINITVAEVIALWGYQFNLTYDTSVLTATGYSSYSPFVLPWPSEINDAEGYVAVAYSMMFGEDEGFSTTDPVPIAKIDFTVDAEGDSLLGLHDTELASVAGESLSHMVVDGYFATYIVHDIAVTNVTLSKTVVGQDYPMSINVTVANQGDFTETFEVTVYADQSATIIGDEVIVGMRNDTLASMNSTIITFTWNTTDVPYGDYTLSAVVTPIPGETNTDDDTFIDGTVLVTVPGDVNGDRVVDIFDAGFLSAHWYPGPPIGPLGYDPVADINNDGSVNIVDAGMVSANWGQFW